MSESFQFYVSDDGEVLSNTDYPVRRPLLIIPVLHPERLSAFEYATEEEVAQSRIKHRVFRAMTVKR